ncbi:hypothetical protein G7Z17_g5269 [Cylindrodendrum hubeiense]|uniref:Uncharacterized protein n=1 Tax=Cylindrodendrum hubeiense TaxID=595255 RepID=A0A9P5LHH9_9HYPO|nr:hypothetical protein G7Z17_g5269 [Cylindrodendrum hubeiense]
MDDANRTTGHYTSHYEAVPTITERLANQKVGVTLRVAPRPSIRPVRPVHLVSSHPILALPPVDPCQHDLALSNPRIYGPHGYLAPATSSARKIPRPPATHTPRPAKTQGRRRATHRLILQLPVPTGYLPALQIPAGATTRLAPSPSRSKSPPYRSASSGGPEFFFRADAAPTPTTLQWPQRTTPEGSEATLAHSADFDPPLALPRYSRSRPSICIWSIPFTSTIHRPAVTSKNLPPPPTTDIHIHIHLDDPCRLTTTPPDSSRPFETFTIALQITPRDPALLPLDPRSFPRHPRERLASRMHMSSADSTVATIRPASLPPPKRSCPPVESS